MGQELRSIVLTHNEFVRAAALYYDALPRSRPESQVLGSNIAAIEIPDGEDPTGQVLLEDPMVDGRTRVTIGKAEMIDMMVAFCRDRAIPLPKTGRKTIVRRDGKVILEIELDWF